LRAFFYFLATAFAWIGISAGQAQTAPDLNAAVRAGVKLTPDALLNGAQISTPRATTAPQIGDAMACLKLAGAAGGYVAVFFEHGKVLSYRRAVAFDHCTLGPFSQLAAAPVRAKPARTKKPNVPHHAEAK